MNTILYHGTSDSNTKSILSNGLFPNYKNNWDSEFQQKSLNGFVYLTNNEIKAEYYAIRASLKTGDNNISIIHLDVEEEGLYPDENVFLNGIFASRSDVITAQKKVIENKRKWKESLEKKELVAFSGIIEKENIKLVKNIPLQNSTFYGFIKNLKERTVEQFDDMIYIYNHILQLGWFEFGIIDMSKIEMEKYLYKDKTNYNLSYNNKEITVEVRHD